MFTAISTKLCATLPNCKIRLFENVSCLATLVNKRGPVGEGITMETFCRRGTFETELLLEQSTIIPLGKKKIFLLWKHSLCLHASDRRDSMPKRILDNHVIFTLCLIGCYLGSVKVQPASNFFVCLNYLLVNVPIFCWSLLPLLCWGNRWFLQKKMFASLISWSDLISGTDPASNVRRGRFL